MDIKNPLVKFYFWILGIALFGAVLAILGFAIAALKLAWSIEI